MYGFCCEEFSGVRYHIHYCRQVSWVPMVVPVADARTYQPGLPTMQLQSTTMPRWHPPNAASSSLCWYSGRLAHSAQGRGSSPVDILSRLDSQFSPSCMVAAFCSMLYMLVCVPGSSRSNSLVDKWAAYPVWVSGPTSG